MFSIRMFSVRITAIVLSVLISNTVIAQPNLKNQNKKQNMLRLMVQCDRSGIQAAKQMMAFTVLSIGTIDFGGNGNQNLKQELDALQTKALAARTCTDTREVYKETLSLGKNYSIEFETLFEEEKEKAELLELAKQLRTLVKK